MKIQSSEDNNLNEEKRQHRRWHVNAKLCPETGEDSKWHKALKKREREEQAIDG